jgi:hypothetical protein
MAAVNRQLHASLEEAPGNVRKARRSAPGSAWVEELLSMGECEASLVRAPDGTVFVVEGDRKRSVSSGILAAALEQIVGPPRDVTDDELAGLIEWVPIQLLEATTGVPFVVVGGRRHDATGIPLPFPIDNAQASELPEGDPINVAAANISRRRFEEALTGAFQLNQAKTALAAKGPMGTVRAVGRRVRAGARRALGH